MENCKFPQLGNGRNDSDKLGFQPDAGVGANRLHGWRHSSRIIRVSRATGGKDRHSKVLTSKGLRDRRVRLSVGTAIQFYDLQDRLGFEQPSKAVEWLIEAASDAISELPSLSSLFAETGLDSPEMEKTRREQNHRPEISMARSACSSNNSSGLSLSRSERSGKEKKEYPSFTELLTGATASAPENAVVESSLSDKSTAMDCYQLGRVQHFSIVPDDLNDYNLNFRISGCNRGTLQSNISPPLFFVGGTPPATAPVPSENHHQLAAPALFDGGSWQLRYADGSHHSDQKGKGKN